jgi:hypothetical protein
MSVYSAEGFERAAREWIAYLELSINKIVRRLLVVCDLATGVHIVRPEDNYKLRT